jgi:hypothetical protein
MNPNNGYNKTSGGKKNWHHSKETLAKMSASNKVAWKKNPKRLDELIEHNKLINTPERISAFVERTKERCKGIPLTEYHKQKVGISNKVSWVCDIPRKMKAADRMKDNNYGVINAGIPKTLEHRERIRAYWTAEKRNERSGSKSIFSKPICAFGTLYPSSQDATNALYNTYKLKKKNFVSNWISRGTHANDVFKIHKEFYTYAITCELENITKDFYTTFMEICLW